MALMEEKGQQKCRTDEVKVRQARTVQPVASQYADYATPSTIINR
jgi:hypothetical protein